MPGEDGICVVYGHRNRNHLKVLEKVTVGDIITATKDGIAYTYAVLDVAIYINGEFLIDSTGGNNSVQIRKHWGRSGSEWEWVCFGRPTS